ncbi:MAG: NAD+ synthase [Bacteroidetes bacterium]|nr:NAD+ synthase [Bacteroidota bacterium]
MKIALAQLNYHIGNFDENIRKMTEAAQRASAMGAELVVFAELAVSGYPPRDFLEFDDFIQRCDSAARQLADACPDMGIIVGSPVKNTSGHGKPLYNAALFLYRHKITAFHKTLLPNYDVFDEYRYFEPGNTFEILHFKGVKIALTICEDLWNIGNDPLYNLNPMDELMKEKPALMVNIAASPFNYNQPHDRREVLRSNVLKYKLPLIYVNHVGAHTELLFDGGSMAFNADGFVQQSLAFFVEDLQLTDMAQLQHGQGSQADIQHIPEKIALIHDALVMGIRNYFDKLGFTKAILGLSGGIDSAVTMVLAAEALGAQNVFGLLMPSQFSSDHSVADALALARNLGAPEALVPIRDMFDAVEHSMKPLFQDLPFGLTEENIQARLRGLVLMAMTNKFGYILLNTSNKSEAAVGYGTLYGDMNGGLSVLGDLYKTEVFALAAYINREKEIIPLNTITKPPSAELRPGQKDSDSLPEYAILDELLFQYIEKRKGPAELVALGFDAGLVKRVLRLVNTNEYKRYQTPPILRVSPKAFGMGRRMPIVARYLS